jgi:hypothetical protein
MLFLKPLTGSEDLQPRAVDQQVDRPSGRTQALAIDSMVLALRLKVLWLGVLSGTPSRPKIEAINPSV